MDIDYTEYKKLRDEWSSGLVRTMASKHLGKTCYNCGSDECVELHHVVPLRVGGTNNLSNIVVLCHKCHMAVHHGGHISDYASKKGGGRPHKVSEQELEAAFEKYLRCEIGTSELKNLIKMSPNTKIGDMSYFKKYLKEHGIKKHKNNIDIILKNSNDGLKKGRSVGEIIYINGDVEIIHYAK